VVLLLIMVKDNDLVVFHGVLVFKLVIRHLFIVCK
jgi:hypothetical protein